MQCNRCHAVRSESGHKHRPLSAQSPSLCLHHSRKLPPNSADQASGAPCRPHLTQRRMTMDDDNSILPPPKRTPWNKGKLIGAKPPLLARHVWSIRTKLQIERRARELAMFNLAIDIQAARLRCRRDEGRRRCPERIPARPCDGAPEKDRASSIPSHRQPSPVQLLLGHTNMGRHV